jgi:DNA repair protein RecN (Recombination protein N)
MLASLSIQDIVLIERLTLEFSDGLTVLTGETGAGKSILLDALALALGARGDASLVRSGCERGQVTALFEPPPDHPVFPVLVESGISAERSVLLRRIQTSDGKTRAFVNDQPCGASLLRRLGASLVEIHGQHDDRALVVGEEHRRLLDAFGRLEPDVANVAARFREVRRIEDEIARLRAELTLAQREADFLSSAVAELESLAPDVGEEVTLAERRHFLMRAEKIAGDLNEAYEIIGGSASPTPALIGLTRRLGRKTADIPGLLDAPLHALNTALDNLEEARRGIEEAIRACAFDAGELEETEARLFALRGAARKYQTSCDDLPAVAAEFSARLAALERGGLHLSMLEAAAAEALVLYGTAASDLSSRRAEAARALANSVNAELPALRLEAAEFSVAHHVNEDARSSDGFDAIAFHVRTNPGTAPGPLMKVASGGELSRFLLALKVALADRGSAPTLVFDEIDSGAGGAVAEAIGRRLGRLSERVQVLAVTHAPQVAAHADAHLVITKAAVNAGERVTTRVEAVLGETRREEIARMLAGAIISDEARAAAERLIAGAERPVEGARQSGAAGGGTRAGRRRVKA